MYNLHPATPVRQIDGAVNRLLGDFLDELPKAAPGVTSRVPLVDAWEDEKCLYFEADLPGFEMGDLEVLVHGDVLTLRGKREPSEAANINWRRRERPALTSFERSFQLPHDVRVEQVEATLASGVLRIRLPKAPHALPHKITVKAVSAG